MPEFNIMHGKALNGPSQILVKQIKEPSLNPKLQLFTFLENENRSQRANCVKRQKAKTRTKETHLKSKYFYFVCK